MRAIIFISLFFSLNTYAQNSNANNVYEADSLYLAFFDVQTNELYGEIQAAGINVAVTYNHLTEVFLISYYGTKDSEYKRVFLDFVRYDKSSETIVSKDLQGYLYNVNNEIFSKGELTYTLSGKLIEDRYLIMYMITNLKKVKE